MTDDSGTREIRYDNAAFGLESVAWTAGLLDDFKLEYFQNNEGSVQALEVKSDGSLLYSVDLTYRGTGNRVEYMTIRVPPPAFRRSDSYIHRFSSLET
jgi:hypothetical protein